MTAHLFRANTKTTFNVRYDQKGSNQYVVAEGRSRSVAAQKAMRKVYALNATESSLHSVTLEYLGTVEVAR